MNKLKSVIIAFVIFGTIPVFAGAVGFGPPQGPPGPGHQKGPFFLEPGIIKELLDLSDEQFEKGKKIQKKVREKMKTYHEKIRPLKDKMKKMLFAETVNMAKVRKVLEKIQKVKVEIRILAIERRIEFEKILNPRQKKKLRRVMKKRMTKMRKRHERMKKMHQQ